MASQGRIEGTSYITAGQSRKAVSLSGVIGTTVNATLGGTVTNTNGALTSSDTSGTLVTLATIVVPANTLNFEGKAIRFTWFGTTVNNANAKALAVLFGGGTIMTGTAGGLTVSVADSWVVNGYIMRGALAVQQNFVRLVQTTNAVAPAAGTASVSSTAGSVNLAADLSLVFQTSETAASDIVTRGFIVEVTSEGAPE